MTPEQKHQHKLKQKYQTIINSLTTKRWEKAVRKLFTLEMEKSHYTIIKNVFTKKDRKEFRKFFQDSVSTAGLEPINFSIPHLRGRYQFLFYSNEMEPTPFRRYDLMTPILEKFIEQIIRPSFYDPEFVRASFLMSFDGCNQQPLHCDDHELHQFTHVFGRKTRWKNYSFSMIIAIEENDNPTSIMIDDGNGQEKKVKLAAGSVIVMRGDFRHAGAAYDCRNVRIFISIGTKAFINNTKQTGALDPELIRQFIRRVELVEEQQRQTEEEEYYFALEDAEKEEEYYFSLLEPLPEENDDDDEYEEEVPTKRKRKRKNPKK